MGLMGNSFRMRLPDGRLELSSIFCRRDRIALTRQTLSLLTLALSGLMTFGNNYLVWDSPECCAREVLGDHR